MVGRRLIQVDTMKIVESSTGSGKSAWAAATPYFTDSTDPRRSRLPHDSWRPNQLETMQWLVVLTRWEQVAPTASII
jgi:hypothetical protein